jgi:hypothetical protein
MKEAELFSNARGVSISPAARMRLLAERISTIVMSATPAAREGRVLLPLYPAQVKASVLSMPLRYLLVISRC